MTDRKGSKNETTEDRPEPDEARRAALAKMGRFAGYTAPAMLGLLGATKARISNRLSKVSDQWQPLVGHFSRVCPS